MLFFRSEEAVEMWCRAHGHPHQPTATIAQLWDLSIAWYGNRLTPDARRPQPDEVRRIFAAAGLTEAFWNPSGDAF